MVAGTLIETYFQVEVYYGQLDAGRWVVAGESASEAGVWSIAKALDLKRTGLAHRIVVVQRTAVAYHEPKEKPG